MNTQISTYLLNVKPLLKSLLSKLLEKYRYVSILASDSFGKSYYVNKTGTSIDTSSFTIERGFVAKVYDGDSYCEYAFSYIDESNIGDIVKAIDQTLVPLKGQLPKGFSYNSYGIIEEDTITFSKTSEYEIDPIVYGDEAIIRDLTSIYEEAMSKDEHIVNVVTAFEYCQINKLFLSKEKELEQAYLWSTGVIQAVASKEDNMEFALETCSERCGVELIARLKTLIDPATKAAVELLDAPPITPGEYDCICDPDISGLIAHEAFGHGVEMDMFLKDRALAKQYIGKQVASELVTMHDGASIGNNTGSYFFDDEGVLAQDSIIIDHGIMKKGINDLQTAMTLGVTPTGNGRRERYDHKIYTRMTNTFFEPGTSTLEEMIASIQYGFLIQVGTSGMEDPKNWGIQINANVAREIKDGKLTGKVFSPVIMTGYVPDLLKSISMVSKDLSLVGCGYCGKGHKEFVKVSTGGPYIKARIRLG